MFRKIQRSREFEGQECSITASKLPFSDPTYEVKITGGDRRVRFEGKYGQVEGPMIKEDVPRPFYDLLFELGTRMRESEGVKFELSGEEKKCVCSLSLWKQNLGFVVALTGFEEAQARNILFSLHKKGYTTLVQRGDETRFSLTNKGQLAHELLSCDDSYRELETALLKAASGLDWAKLSGKDRTQA